MNKESDLDRVKSYIPLARFIAAICGPRCEVVLHWLGDVDHSIIFIVNGEVSGRKVGDGLMDYALDMVLKKVGTEEEFVANLTGKQTPDNKKLRISDFFIRDDLGNIIGLLSTNMDISLAEMMKQYAESMISPYGIDTVTGHQTDLALSVPEIVDNVIQRTMRKRGCSPADLSKEDKMAIIAALNEKNLFLMKGVVSLAAKRLRISEPSVYRYLKDLKSA